MTIRSMTGFAQAKGRAEQEGTATEFTLSLKSVNHRFLDLHFRLPAESDDLEMGLRQLLKKELGRGHLDVMLTLSEASANGFAINRELVGGYVRAFREAAKEFGVAAQPDLNIVLRMPGALAAGGTVGHNGSFPTAVLATAQQAIAELNQARAHEGASIERELRERMHSLDEAASKVEEMRAGIVKLQLERIRTRMQEILGQTAEPERILQEAAIMAERSDVQEEIVRLKAHVQHFLGLLDAGGEVGKKLDFLLQEMNREANTMLSKTSGIAGDGLRITEAGLVMKSDIEKCREQVQNLE